MCCAAAVVPPVLSLVTTIPGSKTCLALSCRVVLYSLAGGSRSVTEQLATNNAVIGTGHSPITLECGRLPQEEKQILIYAY